MFYEDVKVVKGETISGLGIAYGWKVADWTKIWNDGRNAPLKAKRGKPEQLQIGDVVQMPIPWIVVSQTLEVEANGVGFTAERDGERGTRLSWVQTVYRHNQPIGPNPDPFCVDACTPDDELPFYWTTAELTADPKLRKTFIDHPSRSAPSAAKGTTKWRAVTSLAVVTVKRITVYNSIVWGFNMTPANDVTMVGPRDAQPNEVQGHLRLLRNGKGTAAGTFGDNGYSFRQPPA